MSKIIAIVNQKGGVGKTTTAVNLGAYLSRFGKFVLLVDLDPQANATSGLGINHQEITSHVYHTLLGQKTLKEIVMQTRDSGYKVAPAHPDLAGARVELVSHDDREFKLYNAALEIRNDYD